MRSTLLAALLVFGFYGCPSAKVLDGTPDTKCNPGTTNVGGECVPDDAAADAIAETEPNDPLRVRVGVANSLTLPAENGTVRLTGVVAPIQDVDGDGLADDHDLDLFEFDGVAGTRLLVEATPIGAPAIAVAVVRIEKGREVWTRRAFPVGERDAAREVVLPFTGRYTLIVADPGVLMGDPGDPLPGGSDATWVVAVTRLANPAPEVSTTGNLVVDGDLADVPQTLIQAPGTLVEAWLDAAETNTHAVLWLTSADYGQYFGEVASDEDPAVVVVPAGGLLLTVDYVSTLDGTTSYQLESIEHPIATLDVSSPVFRAAERVPAGGVRAYGISLATDRVVRASADTSAGDADVELFVIDASGRTRARSYGLGNPEALAVALPAGDYHLFVYEYSAADRPGTYELDLEVDSWPLATVGAGTVAIGATETATGIEISDEGERAYFRIAPLALGRVEAIASPAAGLDVILEVFDQPQLSAGSIGCGAVAVDSAGAGGSESGVLDVLARDVFFAVTVAPGGAPAGSTVDLAVALEAGSETFIEEGDHPTPLGTLSTTPVYALGELSRDAVGLTTDTWSFRIEAPARVRFTTSAYGGASDATRLELLNRFYDPIGGGGVAEGYESLEASLDAGDYFLTVEETNHREGNAYVLTGVVVEGLLCWSESMRCDGGTLYTCDPGNMSETPAPCSLGCDGDACAGVDEAPGDNGTYDAAQDLDGSGSLDEGIIVVRGELEDTVVDRDMDWYAFTLAGPAEVSMLVLSEFLEPEIWIYDADLEEVAHEASETLAPVALAAGDYLVRFGTNEDYPPVPGTYQILIDVRPLTCFPNGDVCNADVVEECNGEGSAFVPWTCHGGCTAGVCDNVAETESNNDAGSAQSLGELARGTRVPIAGSLSLSSDEDWYGFSVDDNVLARIETMPTGGADDVDSRLDLYPSPDTGHAIASHDGSGAYSLIDHFLTPGVYFVRVTTAGATAGAYRLMIEIRPPDCDEGETRCGDGTTLQECFVGRWGDWACLSTCSGTPAGCTAPAPESSFSATFPGDPVLRRVDVGVGDKLSFSAVPSTGFGTILYVCPAEGGAVCDWDHNWLVRASAVNGNTNNIDDWLAPSTGGYLVGVDRGLSEFDPGTAVVTATSSPVPKVLAADMAVAARGGTVVLTGVLLSDVTEVEVGGSSATFTVDSDTQLTIDAIPDTACTGKTVPIVVTSPDNGTSYPFRMPVIALVLTEVDAQTSPAGPGDNEEYIEISVGYPGLDLTGAGYSLVLVSGSDADAGEAYRAGIPLDAAANENGMIVIGNAAMSPDIPLADDSLDNGYDGVAIVQAASVASGTDVSGLRIIDGVAYNTSGFGEGQASNVEFLWDGDTGVLYESLPDNHLERCTGIDRRRIGGWVDGAVVAGRTPGAENSVTCPLGEATQTYAAFDVPQRMPINNGTVCTDIVVPAMPAGNNVETARVAIEMNHDNGASLGLTLTSPASTPVVLMPSENAASYYDFRPGYPIVYEDGGAAQTSGNFVATVDLTTLCKASPCLFDPEEPLNTFDGQSAIGTWQLCVENIGAIPGDLVSVKLELETWND